MAKRFDLEDRLCAHPYLTKSQPINFSSWSPGWQSFVQTDVFPTHNPCSLEPISAPHAQAGLLKTTEWVWGIWSISINVHWKTQEEVSLILVVGTLVSLEPQGGGGRGGTLIFSHIRRLGPFFWVQNSEFQYFLGFSEKLIFLGGMKILWIFFGVITKLG